MVRTDAQANRERILEVARRVLEEPGAASLNRIAQLAGVGPGTLYRHFPTRDALVLAVYRDDVDGLIRAVPSLLPLGPVDALREWSMRLTAAVRRKHGLGDALSAEAQRAAIEETYGPVIGAIEMMLDAGRSDGSIRADSDAADVLQLLGALWRTPAGDGRVGRMLDLVLDGLRAR